MRTRILIPAMFLLLLSVCRTPAAENIASRPVGVMRVAIEPGQHQRLSLPFLPFDSTLDALFRNQLTGSTQSEQADSILKWDNPTAAYRQAFKMDRTDDSEAEGHWTEDPASLAPSDMTLLPGEGFILYNRQSWTQHLSMVGAVMLEPSIDVPLDPGLTLFGSPFTGHAKGPSGSDSKLTLGSGYWYYHPGEEGQSWTARRPYANVFPANNRPPRVTDIKVTDKGVTLHIKATRGTLDIFTQDIPCEHSFDPLSGWTPAARDLTAANRTLAWTDKADDLPVPLVARCYLIVRSDIDSDGDRIPDSHEIFLHGSDPSIPDEAAEGRMVRKTKKSARSAGVPEAGSSKRDKQKARKMTATQSGPKVHIPSPVNGCRVLR